MPQLPTYDSPKIAPEVGPSGALNIQAPNLLAPVVQGAAHAVSVYDHAVQQAEVMKAEEALNKVRTAQTEYTGWVRSLKGKDVFDPKAYGGEGNASLGATAATWMDGAIADAGQGLSGRAAQVFKQGAERFKTELSAHVQQHEISETGVVAKDTYTGALAVEDQNITQNGVSADGRIQGDSITQSIQRKVFAANQLSDYLGEGPDMRKVRELDARSGAHAIVLDSLLKRNNTQGAQVYFDANRGQMDKTIVSAMEGKIQQAALANDVQTQADRIQALGLPLDQQDAEARKVFAKNPEGMHLLQSELEHRFSVQKTAQAAATQETFGKLWDMRFPTLPGQAPVSMPQIMRSQEWANLNGTQRNELRSQWENYSKRNENDPLVKVAQAATFQRFLDDPKSLIGMSDAQIASFTGALGPEYAIRLMEMKRKAAGNLEALKANTLSDIPFRDIAAEYGLKTKGTMTQEDQARLGLLRDQALDAIRSEQNATGKPATPERKEEILRGLLVNTITKRSALNPARWLGDTYVQDGKPLFEVKDFTELDATDQEKEKAVWFLVQAEAPITPGNVQTMITAMRKKAGK